MNRRMKNRRIKQLQSIGFKFNGIYFNPPKDSKYKDSIRHDEVEGLSDKAFTSILKYLSVVTKEKV